MKSHTENLEHASVRQYCKLVRVPAIGRVRISSIKHNHWSVVHTRTQLPLPGLRNSSQNRKSAVIRGHLRCRPYRLPAALGESPNWRRRHRIWRRLQEWRVWLGDP